MDGNAYLETKGKLGLGGHHKDAHANSTPIPTSTPACVIVKSYKAALEKPRGTIKLKTQMDNSFSIFLRGKMTESQFQHTIDGINWFANLLHEAEVEYYAETYSSSVAWKDFHAELVIQEKRDDTLVSYCKSNDLMFSLSRSRISTEAQMKDYVHKVVTALHEFIDDENSRVYMPVGVQWHYPEKNHWRWLEIHILPDGIKSEPSPEPLVALPTAPEFGDLLKFEVLDTLSIDDHAEYIIHIKSNLAEWSPIGDTFVLRRFNDFKDFYNKLHEYMDSHDVEIGMPQVPDASYIGHKSRSTLLKRKAVFQDLLDAIASSKDLKTAPPVLSFFSIVPDPHHWKYTPYLHKQLELK